MSIAKVYIPINESRRDGMFIAKVYTPIIESRRDGMFIVQNPKSVKITNTFS